MEVYLKPAESKVIKISETGSAMLGILVKERTELRKITTPDGQAVWLRQTATNHFVRTSLGAATEFNLELGDGFTLENTSDIQIHVVVYMVKN